MSVGASSSSGKILRLRLTDGSIVKLSASDESSTLHEVVSSAILSVQQDADTSSLEVKLGEKPLNLSSSMSALELKNGAIISVVDKAKKNLASEGLKRGTRSGSTSLKPATIYKHFDPFPDLAKPRFTSATLAVRAKANRKGGLSYGDIDKIASSMHNVETQSEPRIQRIYMCAVGAEAFASGCFVKHNKSDPPGKPQCRHKCAILFGTVSTERLDQARKPHTSLSSNTDTAKMCQVVKVQALWEPPLQKPPISSLYDATPLLNLNTDSNVSRAIELAAKLGYQPVGWIFSYEGNEGDARAEAQVPILSRDVVTAAQIQATLMEKLGVGVGDKFITLALNAPTGATEAFQISDQCIQMTAEGVFAEPPPKEERLLRTTAPVIVDGKETREVDCVLCLVNTAMLSHSGSLSKTNNISNSGKLTSKVKKQITDSLAKFGGRDETIEIMRNFNLLYGLSKIMRPEDVDELCKLVSNYSKGRRKGSEMSRHLQFVLQSICSA